MARQGEARQGRFVNVGAGPAVFHRAAPAPTVHCRAEYQSVSSVTLTEPVAALFPRTAIFCPGPHLMYSTQFNGSSAVVADAVGLSPTEMRAPLLVPSGKLAALTLMA
jgi:hypothetical protein